MIAVRRLLPALLAAVALVACGGGDAVAPAASPTPTPTATAPTDAPTEAPAAAPTEAPAATPSPAASEAVVSLAGPEGERVDFHVEVVAEPAARQQGLMGRTELAPDAGMLFLFPEETRSGFWMKNTLIPLQIAYIAPDGEIVSILDMEPCEADPCEVYVPDAPYTAALEVNAGALDDAGVEEGWRAELPADLPEPQ